MSYAKNFLRMDKIDQLFEAIEHPERFTEAEISTLLQDPEIKDVLDTLDKTKASLQPLPSPDVDAEWKAFNSAHNQHRLRLVSLFSRNIAASILIAIASLAAVATVVSVSMSYFTEPQAEAPAVVNDVTTDVALHPDTTIVKGDVEPRISGPIIFDNAPLETIIAQIANHYGYEAEFKDDSMKSLRLYFRWNQTLPIEDVAGSLNNFEQIQLSLVGKTIIID